MPETSLQVEDLKKTYRSVLTRPVDALKGVSIAVEAGAIYGLIGPNGAGKTTFIKCITGLVNPTGGTGTVLGRPLGDIASRARIGYLPENVRYPAHYTLKRMFSFYGALKGLHGYDLEKRIDANLELVSLAEHKKRLLSTFSKGMLQRAGLAQAILADVDLLFLDEPTDGIDPAGRIEIRDLLIRLSEEGKTIFINSHLLGEVEKTCDSIGFIIGGKLEKSGKLDDLLAPSENYELVSAGLTPETVKAVKKAVRSYFIESSGDRISFLAPEPSVIDAAVDAVRSCGAQVTSLGPEKSDLEKWYMRIVSKSAKGGG